jgi:hypothetical protein
MTTDTHTHSTAAPQSVDQRSNGAATDSSVMPNAVRRVVCGLVGSALAFAAYLMAVRGEAILFDLPAAAARMFCL